MQKTPPQELKIAKTHILGIFFMPSMLCCFFIYYSFISPNPQGKEDIYWTGPVILSLILWGIFYVWNTTRFRVLLHDDFIQVKSLFSNKKIQVANLGIYKIDRYGLHIYQKNYTESPSISISVTLDNSHLLQAWLEKHSRNPEIEAEIVAYENELKDFNENEQYGKNQLDKVENLKTTYKIAQWFNNLSWLVLIWVGFGAISPWTIPFIDVGVGLTILIPIIFAYFAMRYKGFFNIELDAEKINPFPNAALILLFPSVTLLVYWIFEGTYVFDTLKIWQYSFFFNFLVTIPILYAARDIGIKKLSDYATALFLFFCMLGYSYGSIASINLYYDKSEANILPVKVLDKRTGKERKDADHLTLAPWNNCKTPYEIEVPQYLFDKVEKGEYVFLHLKEGYLGIQHYEITTE